MTPTPPHITARAVARVLAGERATRVAADLGVSVHTVLRAVRAAGGEPEAAGRPPSLAALDAIALSRREGITLRAASKRIGVNERVTYIVHARLATAVPSQRLRALGYPATAERIGNARTGRWRATAGGIVAIGDTRDHAYRLLLARVEDRRAGRR